MELFQNKGTSVLEPNGRFLECLKTRQDISIADTSAIYG